MTEHLKVETSFVEALIEQAAWDAAKVGLVEKKAVKEKKVKEQDDEEEAPEINAAKKAKVKEASKKVKEASKKVKEQDDDDEDDEMKEGVEVHTCPLCESTLDEELSDDKIREHVAQIQAALQSIDEFNGDDEDDDDDGAEPSDKDLDAIEAEPESGGGDVDASKKSKKKKAKRESVMKKVKELKKAAKGK